MKNIFKVLESMVIALMMVFFFTACNSDDSGGESSNPVPREDFYGTWVGYSPINHVKCTYIISVNEIEIKFSSDPTTIRKLQNPGWFAHNNPYGDTKTEYPSGYTITGNLSTDSYSPGGSLYFDMYINATKNKICNELGIIFNKQ